MQRPTSGGSFQIRTAIARVKLFLSDETRPVGPSLMAGRHIFGVTIFRDTNKAFRLRRCGGRWSVGAASSKLKDRSASDRRRRYSQAGDLHRIERAVRFSVLDTGAEKGPENLQRRPGAVIQDIPWDEGLIEKYSSPMDS